MNVLNIFVVIVLIGGYVGCIGANIGETNLIPSAPGYIVPSQSTTIPPVSSQTPPPSPPSPTLSPPSPSPPSTPPSPSPPSTPPTPSPSPSPPTPSPSPSPPTPSPSPSPPTPSPTPSPSPSPPTPSPSPSPPTPSPSPSPNPSPTSPPSPSLPTSHPPAFSQPTSSPTTPNTPVHISTTPTVNCAKCFKNINGMCRKTLVDCTIELLKENGVEWTSTHLLDCSQRELEEVKVCSLDCENVFRIGRCPSILNPVCGISIKTGKCKKFANPCLLKQDACRYSSIKDWRITHLAACQYLRIGGTAGVCV